MKRLAACLGLLVWLGACQQTLDADVTRFNTLSASLAGQSFSILPEQGQAGRLEFQHYAELVAQALQSYGMRPVAHEGPAADLVVLIHYGENGSQTQYYYEPPPYWGGMGWGGWGPHYGFGGWGGWYGGDLHSYTTYSQILEVEIYDGPSWRADNRRMVWQGRAVSDSGIRDINVAMPYLVKALFQNFPGPNGQTTRVSVPVDGP